jgi:hypothetical protein
MTTQQDSETAIFGAGIPSYYDWWHSFDRDWSYTAESPYTAPDGWVWTVTAEDPNEHGKVVIKQVQHADLMKAAREMAAKDSDYSSTLRKEARNLVFAPEDHDIDAVIADAILQLAVFGEVVYG